MDSSSSSPLGKAKAFLESTPEQLSRLVNSMQSVDPGKQKLLEDRLLGFHEHVTMMAREKDQLELAAAEQSPDGHQPQPTTPNNWSTASSSNNQVYRTPSSATNVDSPVVYDLCGDSNMSNVSEASLEAEEETHRSKSSRKRKAAGEGERPSKKISDFFGKSASPFASSVAKSSGTCTQAVQTELSGRAIDELKEEQAAAVAGETQKDATINELKDLLANNRGEMEKRHRKLTKLVGLHRVLLKEQHEQRRYAARQASMQNSLRLGHFTMQRGTSRYTESWTDGKAFVELKQRMSVVRHERDDLQKRKRPASRAKKTSTTSTTTDNTFQKPAAPLTSNSFQTDQYMNEQEEIIKLRERQLRKEEQDLLLEGEKLERERNLHIRELKRIEGENASSFKNFPLHCSDRYIFLELLGKGGFSEVYKAFDQKEFRYVACKVHQLSREWKEERKANYLKHASRESKIHEKLDHPRIVRLFDSFVIDQNSFCTVLEYCDGNDLDFVLKQQKALGERDARSIVCQVVSALKYMNSITPPVIHYDLKPGNILLCSGAATGEVKITDFGLSKIKEGDAAGDMELTSQGAGTYWYLPPECFLVSRNGPAMISSKVDVWSVGVVLFQCLFGVKPFGNDLSQASILEQNTILNAREVEFPAKPVVSPEAKAFIRRCLTYHKDERPTVMDIAQDTYLQPKVLPRATNSAV